MEMSSHLAPPGSGLASGALPWLHSSSSVHAPRVWIGTGALADEPDRPHGARMLGGEGGWVVQADQTVSTGHERCDLRNVRKSNERGASRKRSPLRLSASWTKDDLNAIGMGGITHRESTLDDGADGPNWNTFILDSERGLGQRTISLLDGFGASLERPVQFGMEGPPPPLSPPTLSSPSSMYRPPHGRGRGLAALNTGHQAAPSAASTFPSPSQHREATTTTTGQPRPGEADGMLRGTKVRASAPSSTATSPKLTVPGGSNSAYEQAQILLVSLLENFCALYDRNPDKNRRLFMAVCRQLWNMGILTSADFINRSEKLRGVYKEAFRTLVLQAIQGIESSENNQGRFIAGSGDDEQSSADGPIRQGYDDDDDDDDEGGEEETSAAIAFGGARSASPQDTTQSLDETISLGDSPDNRHSSQRFSSSKGDAFDLKPVRSRLETEFRDLVPIGRGGFAQVFRGEHRIDFCRYAFKRIEFKSKTSESYEKIMREIKSLAHLEHPYIVRYHGAWIEEKPREERPHRRRHSSYDVSGSFPFSHGGYPPSQTISSPSKNGQRRNNNMLLLDASNNNNNHNSTTISALGIAIPIVNQTIEFERELLVSPPGYYMIIQMELCQFTLADWLEQRNYLISHSRPWSPEYATRHHRSPRMCIPVDRMAALVATQTWDINPSENCRIFKCIVKALQHIHAKGIIHRDLKPGNILFQIDDSGHYIPKIGDFGLASEMALARGDSASLSELATPSTSFEGQRFLLGRSPLASPCSASHSARTTGLGTCMYAAPEQIRDSIYNEKVDIYSLGIILFELFYPFSTRMERHNVLEDLKNGIIPATFMKTWPKEATFIWSCISKNPDARPSAEQILESEILEQDPEETIERLSMENNALKRLLEAERERVRKLEAQMHHQNEEEGRVTAGREENGTAIDKGLVDAIVDITNFSLRDLPKK